MLPNFLIPSVNVVVGFYKDTLKFWVDVIQILNNWHFHWFYSRSWVTYTATHRVLVMFFIPPSIFGILFYFDFQKKGYQLECHEKNPTRHKITKWNPIAIVKFQLIYETKSIFNCDVLNYTSMSDKLMLLIWALNLKQVWVENIILNACSQGTLYTREGYGTIYVTPLPVFPV